MYEYARMLVLLKYIEADQFSSIRLLSFECYLSIVLL